MNPSNASSTFQYRDSASAAVVKNVLVLALGVIINCINSTLIHTFRRHQIFHLNPRYILFIHLVINDMIQLTSTISLFVSSYIFYRINASVCCLIIVFAIFTSFNTPLNLAVMAVECYVAVCFPLRHAQLCTTRRTCVLIGSIWALSAISVLIDIFAAVATEPRRLFYAIINCQRDNLFRHAVSLKKRDASYIVYLLLVWITIFYTYFRILFAAKETSGNTRKARNTILLHGFQLLLSMLTYVFHLLLKAVVSWFPRHYIQAVFVCYILVQVLPRFISPIVYGLRDKTFRQYLKKYLLCTARAAQRV